MIFQRRKSLVRLTATKLLARKRPHIVVHPAVVLQVNFLSKLFPTSLAAVNLFVRFQMNQIMSLRFKNARAFWTLDLLWQTIFRPFFGFTWDA